MGTFADFKKKFAIQAANTDIPQAAVTLPSNGKKACLRPMKVKEQKEILKAFEKKDEYLLNEAFDKILSSCVTSIEDQPYDNDTVCIQDRQFLLIKIRQLTSGDKIKISHYIQKKEKVEQVEVDLSTFKVVTNEGDLNKEIQLTKTTKVVLGPVTRKNEKDMEKYLKSKGDGKDSLIERRYCIYAALIKEIWDEEEGKDPVKVDASFDNIIDFISTCCTDKDLKEFDQYALTLDFGIKLQFPIAVDDYSNENEEASILSFFIV